MMLFVLLSLLNSVRWFTVAIDFAVVDGIATDADVIVDVFLSFVAVVLVTDVIVSCWVLSLRATSWTRTGGVSLEIQGPCQYLSC